MTEDENNKITDFRQLMITSLVIDKEEHYESFRIKDIKQMLRNRIEKYEKEWLKTEKEYKGNMIMLENELIIHNSKVIELEELLESIE